jgi:hypothetical protein
VTELVFTVTVHQSPDEFTIIPASRILEVPTPIRGYYDGDAGWQQRDTPERLIRFSFSWQSPMAAQPFTDVLALATRLAAHLAAMDDGWPTGEAHVMLLPVVDLSLTFEVTPETRAAARPDPSPALAVLADLSHGLGLPSFTPQPAAPDAEDMPQPVAYCAPGRTAEARAALDRDGKHVSEIREHPWLAGYTAVIVFNTAAMLPFTPIQPAPVTEETSRPEPRRWDYPVT